MNVLLIFKELANASMKYILVSSFKDYSFKTVYDDALWFICLIHSKQENLQVAWFQKDSGALHAQNTAHYIAWIWDIVLDQYVI